MTKCLQCGVDNPDGNAFCENCGKPLASAAGGPAMQTLSDLNTIGGEQTLHRDAYPREENTLPPGTIFAERYTIESLIGIGGMGVVYRAKDRIGDREVALKLIRADRLGGESAVNRLISEGVTTQDIRHRNVVAVYHVDQSEGRPFLSMEYVNGVSLREWHRKQVNARTDVPMAVAARIIGEILDGLQAAHEMGVVHRDLKPENIMLTGEPTAAAAPLKILDFGIARAMGKQVESATGTGLGTPRYMAPEQITNPDSAGPCADLYSLSIIFYELLVDVLPTGGWQAPSSGRSDVPPGIDALIQSGMQNRPASRPQSVADYRAKLNAAMGGAPVVDNRGPDRPQNFVNGSSEAKPTRARNWWKIGGGIFAGLLALGMVGQLIEEPGQPPDPMPTPIPTPVPPGPDPDPTPVPPQPAGPTYAMLSGEWNDGMGGLYEVSVGANGQFSGSGTTGDGVGVNLRGAFSGLNGSYAVATPAGTLPGQLSWDGRDCHLSFRTLSPNGAVLAQGQFHIDHEPNQPCPAR